MRKRRFNEVKILAQAQVRMIDDKWCGQDLKHIAWFPTHTFKHDVIKLTLKLALMLKEICTGQN